MRLVDLLHDDIDVSDPGARDPEFIERVARPAFDVLRGYFRAEVDGLENVPRSGPFIIVGNHNGGPLLPDVWALAGLWWTVLGCERPVYAMVHDAALGVPGLRSFLVKIGGLRASRANAEKVLARGASLLVYPGGELDALKSFWRRDRVDFRGHTGFLELAMTHGVPIVPVVNVGGHEVYLTVFSSERLARWTGLAQLTRVKTLPVTVGLPWGVWATGFVPYLPFPAKFRYRVGAPILLGHDPERARDRYEVVRAYNDVTRRMQAMLDGLRRRRPAPARRLPPLSAPRPSDSSTRDRAPAVASRA